MPISKKSVFNVGASFGFTRGGESQTSNDALGSRNTGSRCADAFQQWAADVNSNGGLLGHAVSLRLYDNEDDTAKTAAIYRKLISQDRVDFVLGPHGRKQVAGAAQIGEELHKPIVHGSVPDAGLFTPGSKFLFLSWPGTDATWPKFFFEWIRGLPERERPRTTAIIRHDAPWTSPQEIVNKCAEFAPKYAQEAGVRTLFSIDVSGDQPDFSEAIENIKKHRPETLVIPGAKAWTKALLEVLRRERFEFRAVYTSTAPDFLEGMGPAGDGLLMRVTYHIDQTYPPGKYSGWGQRFSKMWNYEAERHTAGSYAAAQVMQQTVEGTESLDGDEHRKYMLAQEFDTVMGKFRFNEDGTTTLATQLAQWQNGRLVFVWPQEAQTGKLVFPFTGK